jgi:hypothetical protein
MPRRAEPHVVPLKTASESIALIKFACVCVQLASLAAGVTFGPAKEADIVSVRVYDCDGTYDYSTLLEAYEWIFRDVKHGKKVTASVSVSPHTSHTRQVLRYVSTAGI